MPAQNSEWSRDDAYFAENMRRFREEKGWTQGELSKRLKEVGLDHMHQTTVSRMEKGERAPRVGEGRAIAQVLGQSIASMVVPPDDVAAGNHVTRATTFVESRYRNLTRAAEVLHVGRLDLQQRLDDLRMHQPTEGWHRRALDAIQSRGTAALEWLTIEHAIEDRSRPDDETYYDQYLAVRNEGARGADGEHPEEA